MKVLRLFVSSFVFIFVFASMAFAQTEKTQNSTTGRIAAINTEAFNDKTNGIKELTDAYDKLEIEFKPQAEELKILAEKILKLEKELKEFQNQMKKFPNVGCYFSFEDKIAEYDKLGSEYKQKLQETKPLYLKSELEQTSGIKKKIAEAIMQFAKEKGFALILDISKMDCNEFGCIDINEKSDITAEFIKFYNEDFSKREK